MTQLTPQQIEDLLTAVSRTVSDSITCDQCFELIAVFADTESQGTPPDISLEAVAAHLRQCPCCAYEYEALLESLGVDGRNA